MAHAGGIPSHITATLDQSEPYIRRGGKRGHCPLVRPRAGYVYSITGKTKLGWGVGTLICAGSDVYVKGRGVSTLLILAVLVATILVGCAGAGSERSSRPSEEQQASRTAGSTEPEDEESSGQTSGGRLGHPALGSPDAPVVLTEYSDYQ